MGTISSIGFDGSLFRSYSPWCIALAQREFGGPVLASITRALNDSSCISLSARSLLRGANRGKLSKEMPSVLWRILTMSALCSPAPSRRINCILNPVVHLGLFMYSQTTSSSWYLVDIKYTAANELKSLMIPRPFLRPPIVAVRISPRTSIWIKYSSWMGVLWLGLIGVRLVFAIIQSL